MRSIRDVLYAMRLVARFFLTIVTRRRVKKPTREISTPQRIYAWPARSVTPGITTPWVRYHQLRLYEPKESQGATTGSSEDGRGSNGDE